MSDVKAVHRSLIDRMQPNQDIGPTRASRAKSCRVLESDTSLYTTGQLQPASLVGLHLKTFAPETLVNKDLLLKGGQVGP